MNNYCIVHPATDQTNDYSAALLPVDGLYLLVGSSSNAPEWRTSGPYIVDEGGGGGGCA